MSNIDAIIRATMTSLQSRALAAHRWFRLASAATARPEVNYLADFKYREA
jgi:hypothetical protein